MTHSCNNSELAYETKNYQGIRCFKPQFGILYHFEVRSRWNWQKTAVEPKMILSNNSSLHPKRIDYRMRRLVHGTKKPHESECSKLKFGILWQFEIVSFKQKKVGFSNQKWHIAVIRLSNLDGSIIRSKNLPAKLKLLRESNVSNRHVESCEVLKFGIVEIEKSLLSSQ